MIRPVSGEFVKVFEEAEKEGGKIRRLLDVVPRVLQPGEVHELFVTDEKSVKPHSSIKYSVLGQFKVSDGGMIRAGDSVSIGGRDLGNIAGYYVHVRMCAPPPEVLRVPTDLVPIMLSSDKRVTGNELGLKVGDKVVFNPAIGQKKESPVKD